MFLFLDSHLKTPLIGLSESPIQSIVIRVINKIGRPRSGSPIWQ